MIKKILKYIFLLIVVLAIISECLHTFYPRFFDTKYERQFENNIIQAIQQGKREIPLKNIVPFDWSNGCILYYYSPVGYNEEVDNYVKQYLGTTDLELQTLEADLGRNDYQKSFHFRTKNGEIIRIINYLYRFKNVAISQRANWFYNWIIEGEYNVELVVPNPKNKKENWCFTKDQEVIIRMIPK